MKDFNAAYMEIKLKKGWTISDIIQDLEISEGEFYNAMVKRFSKKLRKYYKSRLEQNQKRREKSKRNNSHKVVVSGIECKESIEIETKAVDEKWSLNELKLRKTQIEKEISKREDTKIYLSLKIREEQVMLKKQEVLLQELYEEINHVSNRIEEAKRKIDGCTDSFIQANNEISDKMEILKQIQKEIKGLEEQFLYNIRN